MCECVCVSVFVNSRVPLGELCGAVRGCGVRTPQALEKHKFRNSGHIQFLRHEANAWKCMKPRGSEGKTGCSAALQRAAIERTGLRQRDGGVVRAEGLSSQKASTGRKPDAAQLSWDVKEGMCTEEDEDEQRPRPIFASERRRLQELSNSRPHAGMLFQHYR